MPISKKMKETLTHLLQEEETDLYILTLHYRNDGDLNFFPASDRERVKKILDVLIQDTQKHSEMIQSIIGPEE